VASTSSSRERNPGPNSKHLGAPPFLYFIPLSHIFNIIPSDLLIANLGVHIAHCTRLFIEILSIKNPIHSDSQVLPVDCAVQVDFLGNGLLDRSETF
jgi:hypothetical protein